MLTGDGPRRPSPMPKSRKKKCPPPKRVLALPDLEQSKAAVLNTLTSKKGPAKLGSGHNRFRLLPGGLDRAGSFADAPTRAGPWNRSAPGDTELARNDRVAAPDSWRCQDC